MHLGNYVGALENWVKLQDEYESFRFVADWHTLTTDFEHTRQIPENTLEMVTDWLAAGLDPAKGPIFVQSAGEAARRVISRAGDADLEGAAGT